MEDNYILVRWPESQIFMGEPWFREEAIFAGKEDRFGSSAYFIPENRILTNELISLRISELASKYSISEEDIELNKEEWKKSTSFGGRTMSLRESIINIKLNQKK